MKNLLRLFCVAAALLLFSCGKKKSDLIVKDWKASEVDLAGTKLTEDQISINYNFKADGTFERVEDGKTDEGKWTLNEEKSTMTLEYSEEGGKAEKKIEELTEDKLILSGEEHTMARKETLVPKK